MWSPWVFTALSRLCQANAMLQCSFPIAAIHGQRSIPIGGMAAMRTKLSSDQNTQMTGPDPKQSLALPQEVEHWSLTTLREKMIEIGAKVVRHGR